MNDIADTIKALGLNHSEAARFLDTHPRTVRHWLADENSPPLAVHMLLAIMVHHKLTPDDVRKLIDFPLEKPHAIKQRRPSLSERRQAAKLRSAAEKST